MFVAVRSSTQQEGRRSSADTTVLLTRLEVVGPAVFWSLGVICSVKCACSVLFSLLFCGGATGTTRTQTYLCDESGRTRDTTYTRGAMQNTTTLSRQQQELQ